MKSKLKQYAIVSAVILLVLVGHIVLGVCVMSVRNYISEHKAQKQEAAVADETDMNIPVEEPVVEPVLPEVPGEFEEPEVYEEPDIGMHDDMVSVHSYDFWKDVSGFKENAETQSEVVKQVNNYLTDEGYTSVDDFRVGNYSSLEAGTWGVDVEFDAIELKLFVYYDGYNDEYTVSQWE